MISFNKVNNGVKIYEKNQKFYKNSPSIKDQINNSKKFAKGLEKIIVGFDNNKIRIGRGFITEPGSIDLSWMHDPKLYEEISQDIFARYNKDKDSSELLSIQIFLDDINNGYIKNKKDALKEFKTVKDNVKNENLRDYLKELELAIFGYDDEEPEYEESIAERTKMRRQNKETNKKDASDGLKRTFAPPDPDRDDLNESTKIYTTPFSTTRDDEIKLKKQIKQSADEEKTGEEIEQTENVYDEEGYDEEGYDGTGYNRWGFSKDGFNKDGYNEWGFDKYELNKGGYNRLGLNKHNKRFNGYNRHSYNRDGFNRGYNINGYDRTGYDDQGYNINGYDRDGFDRHGNKRKTLKKNIPGSGLKILTPQQMLARLPISFAQVRAGNNSQKLKNEIRQLLYSLYRSKKISKTVYKNLIATI